ncbi:hypothetical protein [Nocardia sp. N2S4-5]|uniref:hypothetical protein n=1 Tax=Nocardia sp. N2S4-5 TaxID=3351565 RepID=UPI0037CCEB64
MNAINDGRYMLLLWRAIGMLMNPPGPTPDTLTHLRGVVRPALDCARLVLSEENRHTAGVGIDYALDADQGLNVAAALDHARFTVGPQASELLERSSARARDSYGNIVYPADELGFDNGADNTEWDQNIFSVFTLFLGAGIPSFEQDYTFAGFLFTDSNACRVYIRSTRSRLTYGIDLPLVRPDGGPFKGYAYLPSELAPLVRTGDIDSHRVEGAEDEYCTAVADLRAWLGPAKPVQP